MASSNLKRKQDERHLKLLRDIVSLPYNKQCFDCNGKGPTYVNMTIGSFVCTSCSGILRGLNPPHRVKSISMATFTPEEIEFIQSHGNWLCKKVYLGLYDSNSNPAMESRDESKKKDFLMSKYEKKRWYLAPSDDLYDEARRTNTPGNKVETKPLKTLLDGPPLKLSVGAAVRKPEPQPVSLISESEPAPRTEPQQKPSAALDLFGELEGKDPFGGPPVDAPPVGSQFGGDFAAFPSAPQAQTQIPQSATFPPSVVAVPTAKPQTQPPAPVSAGQLTGDPYKALAELDSLFSVSGSAGGTSIDWRAPTDFGAVSKPAELFSASQPPPQQAGFPPQQAPPLYSPYPLPSGYAQPVNQNQQQQPQFGVASNLQSNQFAPQFGVQSSVPFGHQANPSQQNQGFTHPPFGAPAGDPFGAAQPNVPFSAFASPPRPAAGAVHNGSFNQQFGTANPFRSEAPKTAPTNPFL